MSIATPTGAALMPEPQRMRGGHDVRQAWSTEFRGEHEFSFVNAYCLDCPWEGAKHSDPDDAWAEGTKHVDETDSTVECPCCDGMGRVLREGSSDRVSLGFELDGGAVVIAHFEGEPSPEAADAVKQIAATAVRKLYQEEHRGPS